MIPDSLSFYAAFKKFTHPVFRAAHVFLGTVKAHLGPLIVPESALEWCYQCCIVKRNVWLLS